MTSPQPPRPSLLGALAAGGEGRPLVLVPSVGSTRLSLVRLARAITPRRPVHAFAYAGLEDDAPPHRTIPAMASACADELLARLGPGPFLLGGHCLGGTVALAIALELEARGFAVGRIVVADTMAPRFEEAPGGARTGGDVAPELEKQFWRSVDEVRRRTLASLSALEKEAFLGLAGLVAMHIEAAVEFRARPLKAPVEVLRTAGFPAESLHGWTAIARGGIGVHDVPGDTFSMLKPPQVDAIGRLLGRMLQEHA